MRVCFIFPPSFWAVELCRRGSIPLGIYILSTILKNNGVDVILLDQFDFLQYLDHKESISKEMLIEDNIIRNAIKDTDILGISCDSFNYSVAKLLISVAKEINKNIKIILGGLHATILDDYVINTSKADVILRGEGEERILDLVNIIKEGKNLSNIDGLTIRDNYGKILRTNDAQFCPMDKLAPLSKVNYNLISGLKKINALPIETSRGCLFKCIFCSVLYKGNRRLFPIDDVINCIKVGSKFNKKLFFTDDCFTFEFPRAEKILSSIEELDEEISVTFEARVSDLSNDHCRILDVINPRKIGAIQMGVECGYSDGLKYIKKGITLTQVEKACQIVVQKGLSYKTMLMFIIGFPWETVNECLATIEFALRLKKEYGVQCITNFWIPVPSELWYKYKAQFKVDESIFNDIFWAQSDDIFRKTHPLINTRDKIKLEFLLKKGGLHF
jgi:radical SAM superfamily enzyme YgiQ (UPF0313 family)